MPKARALRFLVNDNWPPPPWFSVSVASKGLSVCVSGLESTLAGISISVDSKGTYVAPKLFKMGFLPQGAADDDGCAFSWIFRKKQTPSDKVGTFGRGARGDSKRAFSTAS